MQKNKRPAQGSVPAFYFFRSGLLGADGVDRTCIYACAAINAGICVNNTLVTLLADGTYRTGIVTCGAIDALV